MPVGHSSRGAHVASAGEVMGSRGRTLCGILLPLVLMTQIVIFYVSMKTNADVDGAEAGGFLASGRAAAAKFMSRFGRGRMVEEAAYPRGSATLNAAQPCVAPAAQAKECPTVTGGGPAGHEDASPPRHPWKTQQLCTGLPDESEFCRFEGPSCISYDKIFFGVEEDEDDWAALKDDWRDRCLDFRYYERRDNCAYEGPYRRPNLPAEAYQDAKKYVTSKKIYSVPLGGRSWGPDDHGAQMTGMPWDIIAAKTSEEDLAKLGPEWAAYAAGLDKDAIDEKAGKLRTLGRISTIPERIRWITDGFPYLMWFDSGWIDHPWHFATAAFQLFALRQNNRSVINVPYKQGKRGHLNFTLGNLDVPPMDYIIAQGGYDPPRHELREESEWVQGVFPLLMQPHTQLVLNGILKNRWNLTENSWVCFPHALMPGVKPYIFTSAAEAHSWRMAAYAVAGVKTPAFDTRPPPKITIFNRGDRGFYDLDSVIAAVNATGLPWELVTSMGGWNWEKQVRMFAGTGILIATHGGALANVMYLPAHAVVIEAFPYLTSNPIYQRLAHMSALHYYKLRGYIPNTNGYLNDTRFKFVMGDEFLKNCEFPHHIGGYDASLNGVCDWMPKRSPVAVKHDHFMTALEGALDDIGCRDSVCREENYDSRQVKYTDYKTGRVWYTHIHGGGAINDKALNDHYVNLRYRHANGTKIIPQPPESIGRD